MNNKSGQALILLALLIPLLLLTSGLIVRSGRLMLVHNRLQSHCDKKILDTLMWQGRGLEQLGKINPYARAVILARRTIDEMIVAGTMAPAIIPSLLRTRTTLIKIQKQIEATQKSITVFSLNTSANVARRKVPADFYGKILEMISPSAPFLPHSASQALLLHTQKDKGFENELGAPLEPDRDFPMRQRESLTIKISSERFLEKWLPLPSEKDMQLKCDGQIQMRLLEEPWKAVLL